MQRGLTVLLLLSVLTAGCSARVGAAQAPPFRTIRDIPLNGSTSRFDYQSLDQQTHRLYVAHLGAGIVTVFDTQAGTVVGDISNDPGAHGVLVVSEVGRVYATATDANQVAGKPGRGHRSEQPLGGDHYRGG
jgi:hypothetical protein